MKRKCKCTYRGGSENWPSPVTASCSTRADWKTLKTHTGMLQTIHMHCFKVVHKDFIRAVQRFKQIWKLDYKFVLLVFNDRSKLDNNYKSLQIHLRCLTLPPGVDLLWGDKKYQNHSCRDQLCLWCAVNSGSSRGHKDMDAAKAQSVWLQIQSAITTVVSEVDQGTVLMAVSHRAQLCIISGDRAAADNWAWGSVATKQQGLSDEINDVVLGLVSPRRGLSPNSPHKVKERTITQTGIHQAYSLFRLSSKWCFWAGSGLITTESDLLKKLRNKQPKSIVFSLSAAE